MSGARENYWSRSARVVQDRIVAAWQELPEPERTGRRLRTLLRDGYPFGEREMWPYQMWLDERAVTLWRAGFRSKPVWLQRSERTWRKPPSKAQLRLEFEDE